MIQQQSASRDKAHEDESDQSSGQEWRGQLVRWRGQCVITTDDGSREKVIATSQRTKHVHKKKRSKLKRDDSGSKTFLTSCCTVASGRGSLKRATPEDVKKQTNRVKLLFVVTGVNPRTMLADFQMADKNEFRLTMCNFYRLHVERGLIQPIEMMLGGVFWLARRVAPGRGAVPKADGDACDDDKLRQNAARDVV